VDIVDSYEYQSLADDPIVNELLTKYADKLAIASKYLGTTTSYKSSNVLRQKIADLYYQYGVEKWGDEYDIVLGGGFLSVRSPYDISAGPIYYGDILNIFPFDNDIVLCKISGYNLKKRFFETTNSNYFISYGEYGASIKNSINTSATYYIVVDTYSLDYAANGLTYVDTLEVGKYARDLLAEYVMAGGFGAGIGSGDVGGTDTPSYTITPIKTVLDKLDTLDYNVSTEAYYIKGTIVSFASTKYGNCTIRDENGDEIYVYGLYDGSGNRYEYMSNKPTVGDTVILYATAKYYRKDSTSTPMKELCEATVVQIIGK
jgi:2',3'-cyclic-nucleotide 2'-phosphodiesterase (5'-nucleotidase family)